MIKKILLAAALTCGLSTTYAAERPPQFEGMKSATLATACSTQLLMFSGAVLGDTTLGLSTEEKTRIMGHMAELFLVWQRLGNGDSALVKRITNDILSQSEDSRSAGLKYCTREGNRLFGEMSVETQNLIRSKAIDFYRDHVK